MKNPIEEYLNELPDGYRELALENRRKWPRDAEFAESIEQALRYAFWRADTPEGEDFWSDVHNHYYDKSLLPELSK